MTVSNHVSAGIGQNIRYIIALFCLLGGVYFLTYSGRNISDDENYLINSMQSFFSRGAFDIAYHADLLPELVPLKRTPFAIAAQEPLHSLLALPLYALGYVLPGIGMMHVVWLFNLLIVVLTACLIYAAIRLDGINAGTAFVLALIFGVGTIIWPYALTFFREPLAGLCLTVSFISARQIMLNRSMLNRQHKHLWWTGVILGGVGVLFTKVVLILGLVAISVMLLPPLQPSWRTLKQYGLIALLVVISSALLAVIGELIENWRLSFFYVMNLTRGFLTSPNMAESLFGYLISPGRSFFLYSPVLILSLYGSVLLWRWGEKRLIIGAWLALILIAMSYSSIGEVWWGGNGWGPRYLIPLVPMFFLMSVPAMLDLWARGRTWRVSLALIVLLSVGVQILGTTVSFYRHYNILSDNNLRVGVEGIWDWEWSSIPTHLALWNVNTLDVAWRFTSNSVWMVLALCMVIIVLSAWLAYRGGRVLSWGLPMLVVVAFGLGIYQLRDDSRYVIHDDAPAMVALMSEQARPGDIILIQVVDMRDTFLNKFKSRIPVVTLSYAPGENFDPAVHPEEWRSVPPAQLLNPATLHIAASSTEIYQRIWLITNANRNDPNELRATERYLLENFYPIATYEISPFGRAVLFDITPLTTIIQGEPVHFDEQVALMGYALPDGTSYQSGDAIPIALGWSVLEDLREDYLISIQFALPAQPPIAQYDGLPNWGFGRTSQWQVGQIYMDYYGLQIPSGTPPGDYNVQLIVYRYPTLERLQFDDGDVFVITQITVAE